MLLIFSPFSFLFTLCYLSVLLALTSVSDFVSFWLLMEFMMLLFIGVSYTVFTNSVSSLIIYFFIQSVSSFMILTSYFICSPSLLTLAFFLNLGMFPFVSWYIACLYRFPSVMLLIASTLQNLPPMLLLVNTGLHLTSSLFWLSSTLTLIVAGWLMLSSQSLRFILVASSVGNNSWLLLSVNSSFISMTVFTLVYFALLLSVFMLLGQLSEPLPLMTNNMMLCVFVALSSLSGLPPSPLFLGNVLVISSLLSHTPSSLFVALFLISSVLSASSYFCFSMVSFVNRFRA